MRLQIVAHCHNYSRCLAYQLSSLFLHPPQSVEVEATIFYCPLDRRTADVLEWFGRHSIELSAVQDSPIILRPWPLDQPSLCRRAIGRNLAAKASKASWLWLCDVDYIFGPGCIDALPAALASVEGPLAFPRHTFRTRTQEIGDEFIEAVSAPGLHTPPLDQGDLQTWEIEKNLRAIGGIQIYRGSVARRKGYLSDSRRFQRPADTWKRTFDDRAFRGWLGAGAGEPIDVSNLFRLRHSRRGRFDVGLQL